MLRKNDILLVPIIILFVFLVTRCRCSLSDEVKTQTTPPNSLPAGYTENIVNYT